MATLSQDQLDRRLAEIGGGQLTHSGTAGKRKVPNPSYNKYDPASTETIELDIQQWVSPTGHKIQAVQMPDGSWDVLQDEPPAPKPPTASSSPQATKPSVRYEVRNDGPGGTPRLIKVEVYRDAQGNEQPTYEEVPANLWPVAGTSEVVKNGRRIKVTKFAVPGLPDREDDAGEDPNSRPEARVGKPTGNTRKRTENGTTTTETEYLLPDGKTEWRTQTDVAQPDRVGKPTGNTRERTENGQVVKEAEYVLADGTKEWRSQTAPAEGTNVNLAGAPQLDLSSPERARATYRELFQFVDRQVREGKLTAEKAKAYLVGPHTAVSDLVAEATERRQADEGLRRDQLTERSQDMAQTGNRLQFSQGAANTAIKTSGDLIKAAEGGSSTIVPLMVLQAGMGQAMGGFREAPSVTRSSGLVPQVAQVAGAGFTPPADPSAVGQANQLGLGAIGNQSALGVPMTREHALANPVFRPAPATNIQPSAPAASRPPAPMMPPGMASPPTGVPGYDEPVPPSSTVPSAPGPIDYTSPGAVEMPTLYPSGGNVQMAPNQILRSGVRARTADDLERELLAEGYSEMEIREARRRAEQRAGFVMSA